MNGNRYMPYGRACLIQDDSTLRSFVLSCISTIGLDPDSFGDKDSAKWLEDYRDRAIEEASFLVGTVLSKADVDYEGLAARYEPEYLKFLEGVPHPGYVLTEYRLEDFRRRGQMRMWLADRTANYIRYGIEGLLPDIRETFRQEKEEGLKVPDFFGELMEDLRDYSEGEIWSDGAAVLVRTESAAAAVADLIETKYRIRGYNVRVRTGYYDPEKDRQNGVEDRYTGWHYVII